MLKFIEDYGGMWSLIGLGLTILTFIGVLCNRAVIKKLNKKNFKINRMPENLDSLKKISNKLSVYLADFNNNKKQLKVEISRLLPVLKSLKKSLNSDEIDNYNTLKQSISKIDNLRIDDEKIGWFSKLIKGQKKMTEVFADDIDIKLSRLITDIENIGDDNKKNLVE